jgi:hypothetical protein
MVVVRGVDDLLVAEPLDDLAQHVFIGLTVDEAPWCRSSHIAKTPRARLPARRSSSA